MGFAPGRLVVVSEPFCGTAIAGVIAPQVVHSKQRMQPVTLTFSSTFTPTGQRLRQRLHSTHAACGGRTIGVYRR